MKFAKIATTTFAITAIIYIGVFLFWVMLATGCMQYVDQHGFTDNECGQDVLSQTVRVTHAPLIRFFVSFKGCPK